MAEAMLKGLYELQAIVAIVLLEKTPIGLSSLQCGG